MTPCPQCRFENRDGVRFCEQCGAKLEVLCAACGAVVPPDRRFCGSCGQSLTPSTDRASVVRPRAPAEGTTPDRSAPEAERRQLTVLFCDLVGSTALSERLDPEELRVVIREYQAACAEVIGRFDGHIAQYLGDGLLVYFGYAQAHEDDAQRAVRAGLGVLDRVTQLTVRVGQDAVGLAVRVGIHTGLVVVGEVGAGRKHEQLALGETPNVAARLQGLAEPGTVVISGATRRLVQGAFVLRDLGRQALKGVVAPMAVFHVLGESEVQSSLDVPAAAGLTPLVGREQEAGLLLDRWEQVTEGQGQVVLLSGEPGIGKSRLVQVVKDRVAGSPHRRLECRCSPYYTHSPLYPVIDLLPRVLEWGRDETPEGKLAALGHRLADYSVPLADVVPLLASLLSLPPSARYPLPPMSPERQKRKTLEAILAVLLAMAAAEPVLFIVEDLHWIDPTT
ncbi:MAG: AAA family ATPase, partial [Candidatus Rokubacteria bacterium]|nr:AAA family ATPase [Candidatus Rokubacteria bacterium]